jgi:hypothetical protein
VHLQNAGSALLPLGEIFLGLTAFMAACLPFAADASFPESRRHGSG